jgi:LmbE family N-acetylglucosaminyl deacetylase
MKPTSRRPRPVDLLALGAHPDDIEFGCGGVIARETQAGRSAHFIVCSKGESATRGTPLQRVREARQAAGWLGATIAFADLGGDAHFEESVANVLLLARLIRQHAPAIILAPTCEPNQHPDHVKLGRMVRDAARLARYGGVRELRAWPAHAVGQVLFYAVSPGAEPEAKGRLLVDVSPEPVMKAWRAAMAAHASQMATRDYVDLQVTRARLRGHEAGVGHAIALWPNDTPVFDGLTALRRAARRL